MAIDPSDLLCEEGRGESMLISNNPFNFLVANWICFSVFPDIPNGKHICNIAVLACFDYSHSGVNPGATRAKPFGLIDLKGIL